MKFTQNLLPVGYRQRYYDKFIIKGTSIFVMVGVLATIGIYGYSTFITKQISSMQTDKGYIDSLNSTITSINQEITVINEQVLEQDTLLNKYDRDPSFRTSVFETQNFLRFILNSKPATLAILSIEANNDTLATQDNTPIGETMVAPDDLSNWNLPQDGTEGDPAASGDEGYDPSVEETAEGATEGTAEGSDTPNQVVTNENGELVDALTGIPVDENGNPIGAENIEVSLATQQSTSTGADGSSQAYVLAYKQDLAGSSLRIRGYSQSLADIASFVTAIADDKLYTTSYNITGVEESIILDEMPVYIFEAMLTLRGEGKGNE